MRGQTAAGALGAAAIVCPLGLLSLPREGSDLRIDRSACPRDALFARRGRTMGYYVDNENGLYTQQLSQ